MTGVAPIQFTVYANGCKLHSVVVRLEEKTCFVTLDFPCQSVSFSWLYAKGLALRLTAVWKELILREKERDREYKTKGWTYHSPISGEINIFPSQLNKTIRIVPQTAYQASIQCFRILLDYHAVQKFIIELRKAIRTLK